MNTSTTAPTIRRGTEADADAVSSFGRRAFSDTFAADNQPEDLATYLASAFSPDVQRRELQNPATTCLMMERHGVLIAYAMLCDDKASPHVTADHPMELVRFYVDKSAHGTGVAQSLMSACVDTAASRGAGTLFLGVWERNTRAIRFYNAQGFAEVGRQTFAMGDDVQQDLVLARPVAP